MLVVKPLRLSGLFRPFPAAGKRHLALTVIAPFKPDGKLALEVELFRALMKMSDHAAGFDLGMPKPRGEVLAIARAFAPGGQAPVCQVRLRCGAIDKALSVSGDRVFGATGPGAPAPFTSMPIDWAHAFGGRSFDKNPEGRGADTDGEVRRMPNVESEDHRMLLATDRPEPQSFGPLPVQSPDRMRGLGTYDKRWLETAFPGPPDDFDWSIYNAAPLDQRLDDFLTGGEPYRLENLHPQKPILEGTLPRCLGRTIVKRKDIAELVSIKMRLDTALFVPHEELTALVYRGTCEIDSDDASDVEAILFALDALDAPRPLEHYARVLAERSDRKRAHLFLLRDVDLVPEGTGGSDPLAGLVEGNTREGLMEANMRRRGEKELAALRAELEAQGVDPDAHGVPRELPPPEEAPSLDDLAVRVDQAESEAEKLVTRTEEMRKAASDAIRGAMIEAGLDPDAEEAKARARQGGPPTFSAREEVLRMLSLRGEPANTNVDEAMLERLARTEAMMIDAYRRYAHFMPRPERDASAARALLQAHVDGDEPMRHKDFTGADLTSADLAGKNLDDTFLEGARLDGTKLTGASCKRAVLARAEASGASFSGAALEDANLADASLRDVDFSGAHLDRAVFHKSKLQNCTFEGAHLNGADWLEASFANVDFAAADLSGALFLRNDLRGVSFRGAKLSQACFVECTMTDADFSDADLEGATFVSSRADAGTFRRANLINARFVGETSCRGASFVESKMSRTNFRDVDLENADFSAATLDTCDFSGARMRHARLFRAIAKSTVFDRADLSAATCLSANLLGASFRSATLLATDLRDTNLFEADFFHARTDDKTDVFAANITRAFLYDWRPAT